MQRFVRGAHSLDRAARNMSSSRGAPGLIFPGCGIFFWWQAGALEGLSKRLDLSAMRFSGASGGALTATLAACNVTDSEKSLDVALRLCYEAGVFERGTFGLRGIWGAMVRMWLHEVLPSDAAARCSNRVFIKLHRPLLGGSLVSEWTSRDDLIDACMASVHVPLFMDGALTASFRGASYVDSDLTRALGFQRGALELALPDDAPSVKISRGRDKRLREKYSSTTDTLRLASPEGVREMIRWGEEHIDELDAANVLCPLNSARRK